MDNKRTTFMPSEYDQYLSFLDLEEHPEWKGAWKAQNKRKVESILYAMGCEISLGYEIEVLLHRSRITQKVEYGPRVSYSERTDPEWIRNGMSIEDQIMRTTDIALQGQLKSMNKPGFTTGEFLDYAKSWEIEG